MAHHAAAAAAAAGGWAGLEPENDTTFRFALFHFAADCASLFVGDLAPDVSDIILQASHG
jgi:hypothetical protein